MDTLAYKGTMTKTATLAQLREHRKLDQIVQGTYWVGNGKGKGCAVGCLTHDPSGGHYQFPDKWGVPVQLAYLIDHIFESLPDDGTAQDWPVRIMAAIKVGSDLSGVFDRWALWMLRRLIEKAPAGTPMAEVEVMASLFERETNDDPPSETEWTQAAWAAWAAEAARATRAAQATQAASRHEWGRAAADELVRLVKAA